MPPPITQVMATLQFSEPMRNFNVIELGDIARELIEDYPVFNQVNAAGPMPINIAQVTGVEPAKAAIANFPRLRFDTADGEFTVLFQQDRLSCSWQRPPDGEEITSYPGFEEVLSRLMSVKTRLAALADLDFVPFAGEIAYTNYFPTSSDEGRTRLSSIFSLLEATDDPIHMMGFLFSWNELITKDNGVIQVSIGAPALSTTPQAFALLEMTGSKTFSEAPVDITGDFLSLRMNIREAFQRIVKSNFRGVGED